MKDEFEEFVFGGWRADWDAGRIVLIYRLDEYEFNEIIDFGEGFFLGFKGDERMEQALDWLHLVSGVSYWKVGASKKMVIDKKISKSWQSLIQEIYHQGMGQFFYENEIEDWRERGIFGEECLDSHPDSVRAGSTFPREKKESEEKVLLPIGGGKDSDVSAVLLEEAGIDFVPFAVNVKDVMRETARRLGKELLEVKRMVDPKLLELNKQGALNGHVPITAINMAIATIVALVKGYRYVAWSNGRESDEGNFVWQGMTVNHQWSKSLEFEEQFGELVKGEFSSDLDVFSLLRSLSEFHIAKILVEKGGKFLPIFQSCNRNFGLSEDSRLGSGTTRRGWCGECPKCAFVFVMMAAWLPLEKIRRIFGKNMIDDVKLIPLWRDLLGIGEYKPFECVGTADEVVIALWKIKNRGGENRIIDGLLEEFVKRNPKFDFEKVEKELLTPSDMGAMPDKFRRIIDNLK